MRRLQNAVTTDMIGTPKLMPKSLRLIAAVAAKPTVALFGGLGLMPAPTRRTCSVIGLVTPFIVRSPSIVASLSFSTTFVEVKWASGNFAASKNFADCKVWSRWALVVVTRAMAKVTSTLLLWGCAGSIVRLPDG